MKRVPLRFFTFPSLGKLFYALKLNSYTTVELALTPILINCRKRQLKG